MKMFILIILLMKNFLHLVFSKDDKIILGEINKRSKMNNVISLSCFRR